jgi:arylsulfatase A-like enzyme
MVEALGPYLDNTPRTALAHGWYDTYFEELDHHVGWLGRGAQWLMNHHDWGIYWTQCHSPDYIKHELWGGIDPVSPGYRPELAEQFWEIFARDYQAMDGLLAQVAARADEHTLVVVVSDHGHFAARRSVYLSHALRDAGLLVVAADGRIDAGASKVRGFAHDGVFINHAGRYPDGCVGEAELPAVREELASAMAVLRDPESGARIYQLLLAPEQAGPLGVDDSAGDLIAAATPGYLIVAHPTAVTPPEGRDYVAPPDPEHGMWGGAQSIHEGLPSGMLSLGTNCATLIMAGPGVRRGYRRPWPVWLRDVAPTLAWALGVPAPAQATGQPIADAFA